MAVYDDQKEEKSLTPADISKRESDLGRDYENNSLAYYRDAALGRHSETRDASINQDRDEKESLQKSIGDNLDEAKEYDKKIQRGDNSEAPDKPDGIPFRSEGKRSISSRVKGIGAKKLGIGAGVGGGVIGTAIAVVGIFGFLNTFNFDHIISNLDSVAFRKVNAVFDRRSDRWMRAYITTRLMEWDGTNSVRNNHFFRASGVDTDRPFSDWYRTLRTSGFENKVFAQNGIHFTSIMDSSGNVKPGRITYRFASTGDIDFDFDIAQRLGGVDEAARLFDTLQNGDRNAALRELNRLDQEVLDALVETEVFENDKQARRQIKRTVRDNTRFFQVIKRRHLRKNVQNMIGVRDWRFFETTRDKMAKTRNDFTKRMMLKIIPESTKSGKFLTCVFGIGACPSTTDPASPESRSGTAARGSTIDSGDPAPATDDNGNLSSTTDADGNPSADSSRTGSVNPDNGAERIAAEAAEEAVQGAQPDPRVANSLDGAEKLGRRFRTILMSKILTKVNVYVNAVDIVGTMDMLLRIHKNIMKGALNALVVAARASQALAVYTTFNIMRDQMKSGDFTPEELGYAMEGLKDFANSEAGDFFLKGSPVSMNTVSAIADKDTFCSDGYEKKWNDYYYLCDDVKIGGASNAKTIEDTYQTNPVFAVVRGTLDGYDKVRNAPGIRIFGDILAKVGDVVGRAIIFVLQPIIGVFDGQLETLVAWIGDKLTVGLGAGPILTGDFEVDPSGLVSNMVGQGAAYGAELQLRNSGASRANDSTTNYMKNIALEYSAAEDANMSIFERYFALSNHRSVAATTLFSVSNMPFTSFLGNISKIFSNSFNLLLSPTNSTVRAASDSFGAAEFAGLETWAFPPVCIENNPLTVTPLEMTNADDLGFIPAEEITWDLLGNDTMFWDKVYENVDEDEQDIIKDIYNCELLDKVVRGGLGYTSGYLADGGLNDNSTTSTSSGGLIAGQDIEGQDTSNMQCPSSPTIRDGGVEPEAYKDGTRYSIRICHVHGVRINAIAAANYDALFTAMASQGYTVKGSSGFRDMASQVRGWNGGRGSGTHARPGHSNHQFGVAVDISCQGGGQSYQQGSGRGRDSFLQGVKDYPCLDYIFQNSHQHGLLLQCAGQGSGGGEIRANSGGCEWWHVSPTGG